MAIGIKETSLGLFACLHYCGFRNYCNVVLGENTNIWSVKKLWKLKLLSSFCLCVKMKVNWRGNGEWFIKTQLIVFFLLGSAIKEVRQGRRTDWLKTGVCLFALNSHWLEFPWWCKTPRRVEQYTYSENTRVTCYHEDH